MNKKLITLLLAMLFAQLCICETMIVTQGNPSVDKGKPDTNKEFNTRFAKKYPQPSEAEYRRKIFQTNKAANEAHNKDSSNT